ncbi:DUF4175 family protein, partial [Enterovirga sp.]|uniref:DUF4175 family protein n=1 Tax=Enterovirga sp. TaxID=2026350 RepID=UPI0026135288
MTDRDAGSGVPIGPENRAREHLSELVRRATASLVWERAWPILWGPLAVLLLFLTVSWLGLWLDLSVLGRQVGLALFGLAFLLSLWPALRFRMPRRDLALDRVDRDSGAGHRPARAFEDSLALGSSDPGSRALWELHRRRAARAVAGL